MSMEQAILELVAAQRESNEIARVAVENSKLNAEAAMAMVEVQKRFVKVQEQGLAFGMMQAGLASSQASAASAPVFGKEGEPPPAGAVKADAELEEAVVKVEKEARREKQISDAPKEKMVAAGKVIEKAKEDPVVEPEVDEPVAQLDYKADVKPTLLKLNQEKGRDALSGLLKKYNAPNGDKIKPEDLGAILADAQTLLAA